MNGAGRRRGKKPKFNNPYKIPNEKASEVWGLPNKELVERIDVEYRNWQAVIRLRKDDAGISSLKEQKNHIQDEIKSDPRYLKAEAEFQAIKEELITEELARLDEELKNLLQPYNEDAKSFKGLFRLCIDELNRRRTAGLLNG